MLPPEILSIIYQKAHRAELADALLEMQLRFAARGLLYDTNPPYMLRPVTDLLSRLWKLYRQDFETFHTYYPELTELECVREYQQQVSIGYWTPIR